MLLIILSIVLVVILFVLTTNFVKEEWDLKKKVPKYILLLGLTPLLFGIISIIPANTVGVMFSPINGTQEQSLREGINFKSPLDKVYKISTQVQTQTLENLYGQTKDAQYITMTVDIKYSVNKQNAMMVFKQFQSIKNVNENLIKPATQRSMEQVMSEYSIIDVLGENRNNVYKGIESALTERLSVSGIDFYSITFLDTDAGEQIENAIMQEAIVAKQVETAKQEKQKAVIDAETLQISTQAKADARILDATASAKQFEIEAEGKVKSYNIKNQALNDNILFLEWLNKWDGALPKVQGENGNILDISEFMK